MNTNTLPARVAFGAALVLILAACSGAAVGSPAASSVPPSTPTPSPSVPADSPEPSTPPPAASPSPATTIGELTCSSQTGGDIDYAENPSGGPTDLEAATRALRGILANDQVVVEGDRSGVIRGGRTVWAGGWFQSTSGGWLLSSFSTCGDAEIGFGRPSGLMRDAIAEVVVDGLRVRGLPSTSDASAKFERLLDRNDHVFIVDGPVQADGYDWYLVQSMVEGDSEPGAPFGWVAAASRDGQAWIDDVEETDCPTMPSDAGRLGVIAPEVLIHCFGRTELSFELDANVYCLPDEMRQVEPAWFGAGCGELSGDACGGCGLEIAADPALGVEIPRQQSGHWAFQGHFDDPAAATCHGPTAGDSQVAEQFGVHLCRTTFVLSSLERLGDQSD